MSQKVITICDECGKKLEEPIKFGELDFCRECHKRRWDLGLMNNNTTIPFGKKCPACEGEKRVKVSDGPCNSDYKWEMCTVCLATGLFIGVYQVRKRYQAYLEKNGLENSHENSSYFIRRLESDINWGK